MTREQRGMAAGRKKTEEGKIEAKKIDEVEEKRLKSAGLCPGSAGRKKNGDGSEEGRRSISTPGFQAEGGTPKAGKPDSRSVPFLRVR